jgi:hypothetical protein
MRRERCCQKADGCKAQSAAHVGHLGKLCNAADAAFWRNPKGRGAAGALLRCRTCEWEAPFAASSALHRIPPRRRRYRRLKSDRLLDRVSVAFGIKKAVWTRLNESGDQQGSEGKERYRAILSASVLF